MHESIGDVKMWVIGHVPGASRVRIVTMIGGRSRLHPTLYLPDSYSEREFSSWFGFETISEGSEFPGFPPIRCGIVTAVTATSARTATGQRAAPDL
jgi:hypothetical protein